MPIDGTPKLSVINLKHILIRGNVSKYIPLKYVKGMGHEF